MREGLISLKDAQAQLGISAVGLDNHIKKKEIKKEYEGRKAFIRTHDFEIIKKAIELNGRVKKIVKKDSEELELLKRKNELEKENEELKNQVEVLNNKVESTYDTIMELKKDKDDLKVIIEHTNNSLLATQKLLHNEQELHKQEKERRIAVENKLRTNILLLESATTVKEEIEEGIKEKDAAIKELALELENERNSKELLINENNKYANMSFLEKLIFLFKK